MRYFVKKYADGDTFAIETSDDGTLVRKKLKGTRGVGKRISAYIDLIADNNVRGAEGVLEALTLLTSEIKKRKKVLAKRKTIGPKNMKTTA